MKIASTMIAWETTYISTLEFGIASIYDIRHHIE